MNEKRKQTERKRTPPGKTIIKIIDELGHENTQEARKVMKLDAWHACIEYGYWTKG